MSEPARNYIAIGDIHGMKAQMDELLARIEQDWHPNVTGQPLTLIFLGDYVDRGPDSAGVIDKVMQLQAEAEYEILALKGNHEDMMLNCAKDGQALMHWLGNGGTATLKSYGLDLEDFDDVTPQMGLHMNWLSELPTKIEPDGIDIIFVHAGIDPRIYPAHDDRIHMWTRADKFFDTDNWEGRAVLDGKIVVHGHTAQMDFKVDQSEDGRRINIDTGACYGGQLTAAVFEGGSHTPQFIHV